MGTEGGERLPVVVCLCEHKHGVQVTDTKAHGLARRGDLFVRQRGVHILSNKHTTAECVQALQGLALPNRSRAGDVSQSHACGSASP